ncbi:MAG: FmdE family protein [Actinomycetota bacterium]|nr:FmdE family protein [Actinomycetota bacterium]MDQ3573701.1 FmdE family protein [Actinomycetota bacterium]
MTDQETIDEVVAFHGHMCPGLAMGIRAAEVGLERIGPHSGDEEVVAIVETDMCGVDAIQFMTGCTFGKGNLVHRDYGKNAYTFVRRSDGRAVRVSPVAGGMQRPPEWHELFAKARAGMATPEERERFQSIQKEGSAVIVSMPLEQLYDVREIEVEAPPPARILASVDCAVCAEPTMETRVRRLDGRELCQPCFDAALAGKAPVAAPTAKAPG